MLKKTLLTLALMVFAVGTLTHAYSASAAGSRNSGKIILTDDSGGGGR